MIVLLWPCWVAAGQVDTGPEYTEPELRPEVLQWDGKDEKLPSLPQPHGLAGAFVGVSGDALIVAGGTSLTDGPSLAETKPLWHDQVYVLTEPNPNGHWQGGFNLPQTRAYGVSLTTERGVVCLGGSDGTRHYADVLLLEWADSQLKTVRLPPMPQAAAFFCGAVIGQSVYVAGGRSQPDSPQALKTFWRLDLAAEQPQWEQLAPWPGCARMLAVAAAQDGSFFLVGGVALEKTPSSARKSVDLTDCYRYDPQEAKWQQIADVPRNVSAAPTPAISLGQSHFAIIGGDGRQWFQMAEQTGTKQPAVASDMLLYHTITDTWIRARGPAAGSDGRLFPIEMATTTRWGGRAIIAGGQSGHGVPTSEVWSAEPVKMTKGFRWPDYGVFVLYLATLVCMGFYFARREKSTNDFFLAGHRVPWWAAALSIFGTQLSAITFMATPALVYRTNWVYFIGNMTFVAMVPVFVFFYIPFFKNLNVTTAYEYLERRFNLTTRLLGSLAFLLFQVGRLGVVLFLPALVLSMVTGLNVYFCIAVMGVLATVYTVAGGIEAVVWTDVLQVFVLIGAALLSLIVIVRSIDGGLATVVSMGVSAGKFHCVDLTWDFATTALWVVVVGRAMEQLISYGSDQTVVQRYLVTPDLKAAQNAMWAKGALTLVTTFIFFGLGTALWAFYKTHPALLNITGRTDDIFSWFVVQQLPAGISGLVIAGLLAAAMSSLDSSMNSMATVITIDFYRRFHTNVSDHHCLVLARWLTALLGLLGTALAMYFAFLKTASLWDHYIKIIGLFGGGLAGLFVAGIFTRRIHGPGIVIGMVASAVVLYFVKTYTDVHFFLYAAIGIASCVVIGYLASLVIPTRPRDLTGLTIHTR